MLLSLALSSIFVVTTVSAQYLVDELPDPSAYIDDPSFYIPPQLYRTVVLRDSNTGAISTIIYIVELFNKLQNFATAIIQPFTVVNKPKPALAPAAPPIAVGHKESAPPAPSAPSSAPPAPVSAPPSSAPASPAPSGRFLPPGPQWFYPDPAYFYTP